MNGLKKIAIISGLPINNLPPMTKEQAIALRNWMVEEQKGTAAKLIGKYPHAAKKFLDRIEMSDAPITMDQRRTMAAPMISASRGVKKRNVLVGAAKGGALSVPLGAMAGAGIMAEAGGAAKSLLHGGLAGAGIGLIGGGIIGGLGSALMNKKLRAVQNHPLSIQPKVGEI